MKPFLYERLRKSLLEEMLSGNYSDGGPFLSNRMIRKLWGVNQRTVDRSMNDLKELGLLLARPRSGYRLTAAHRESASVMAQQLAIPPLPKVEGWNQRVRSLLPRTERKNRWTVLFDGNCLWHERDWEPQASRLSHGSGLALSMGFRQEAALRQEGVDLLMVPARTLTRKMLDTYLVRHRCDGVVFFRRTTTSNAFEVANLFFQSASLPNLTVFEPFHEPGTPCLRVNDRGLGFEAAGELIRTRAERFLILVNPTLPLYHEERVNGALQALHQAGVDPAAVTVHRMPFEEAQSVPPPLLRLLYECKTKRTGLLILNNQLFFRLEPEIKRMGLRVPDQLSIITCGGRIKAPLLSKQLSFMEIKFGEIGGLACRSISDLADGISSHRRWIVESHFRSGDSTLTTL